MNIILIVALLVIIGVLIWALAGGRGEDREKPRAEDGTVIEKTFRRRASDKEIEERFPEEDTGRPRRRKSDKDGPAVETEHDTGLSFHLPYRADEIIPETSQFRIYRRTLLNSEIYAAKGDFTTATSLYEGVRSRIKDAEVRGKIDSDIEYLKKFREKKEHEAKVREETAKKELDISQTKSYDTSQVRITFDGSMPNSINIESVPDTINIGVMDPNREANPEAIARRVSNELKEDMADLREQIREVRRGVPPAGEHIPPAPAAADPPSATTPDAAEISSLGDDIDSLKRRVDRMSRTPSLSDGEVQELKELIRESQTPTGVAPPSDEAVATMDTGASARSLERAASSLESVKPALEGMGDVAREIRDLTQSVKEMAEAGIAESRKAPALTEARYDSPPQEVAPSPADRQMMQDLIDRIPRVPAPPSRPLAPVYDNDSSERRARETAAPSQGHTGETPPAMPSIEKTMEKTREKRNEEPPTDFELLSEYGSDHTDGELSDEEIFAKILDGDKAPVKDNFEILGEKKEETPEYSVHDADYEIRRREDESFYRSILQSDRRKKRELPILKVTYDFTKLPDELSLSREKNIIEYAFYKYKPMLEKANDYIKKRKVRDAINYYKVVMGQNIPPEFKVLIRRNLNDLNEYLEKYLTAD